ncbi:hypothetical protein EVAR_10430_1 [Eumeta japonica]|uniref:Uncharacterized protein n=1 Tax=Eumeta variegata TaxID=151549 RepID=A0A4C1UCI4_EUMVA|nr:hypothetical protein EVAR_10430_1 [Eumeta japonica]
MSRTPRKGTTTRSVGVVSPTRRRPGLRRKISPPSRTCTLKNEGVEDPRTNCPDGTVSDQEQILRSRPLRFDWSKFDLSNWSLFEGKSKLARRRSCE